jgi:hypothetical protein
MLIALCTSRCYLENFYLYHFSCLNLNVLFFFLGCLKIHVQFLKVKDFTLICYINYSCFYVNMWDILGRDECGKCFYCNEHKLGKQYHS